MALRRVATAFDNLVCTEPDNQEAKEFLGKTYEQLGYHAESGPWRNRRRHMQLSHATHGLSEHCMAMTSKCQEILELHGICDLCPSWPKFNGLRNVVRTTAIDA